MWHISRLEMLDKNADVSGGPVGANDDSLTFGHEDHHSKGPEEALHSCSGFPVLMRFTFTQSEPWRLADLHVLEVQQRRQIDHGGRPDN